MAAYDPPRKWKFTYGYGTTADILNSSTDFWIEPRYSGEPNRAQIILHGFWTKTTANADPLIRRAQIENSLVALNAIVGREGTLYIDDDKAAARQQTYANMVLESVTVVQGDNNKFYEVDITFGWGSPGILSRTLGIAPSGSGADQTGISEYIGTWDTTTTYEIAELTSYNGHVWEAIQPNKGQPPVANAIWKDRTITSFTGIECYLVQESIPARSNFKYPFRFVPIRIPDGPGLRTVIISSIRQQQSSGTTLLQKRQAAEALARVWIDRIDKEFVVITDAKDYGNCLLTDVQIAKVDVPDSITFSLVFQTGYLNG